MSSRRNVKHATRVGALALLAVAVLSIVAVSTGRSFGQSAVFGGTSGSEQLTSDPFLGDWQGGWVDPEGFLMKKNPLVTAQVIPRGGNRYQINILPEFDQRCPPYAVIDAAAEGGKIDFEDGDWSGTLTHESFTGSGVIKLETGRFRLDKVARLSPNSGAKPPEGAIVLFDGSGFEQWEPGGRHSGSKINWKIEDDAMRIEPSPDTSEGPRHSLQSKLQFKGCRVHAEFRLPLLPGNTGQSRGNSGVSVGGYEVQVLDSYGLPGYYNECGALYKRAAPMVNMCAPPLQWQTYDITFDGPRFDQSGRQVANARITVLHNGVLIHKDLELVRRVYQAKDEEPKPVEDVPQSLSLQNHGNPVEYRNIWVVDLSQE